MKKNFLLTFLFACVPGAGQMYYGYMKRGLSLILMFFACLYLGWFAEPLIFTSLIVWMYSFFDTYDLIRYIAAGEPKEDRMLLLGDMAELRRLVPQYNKLLGWGLIALGVWALYNNFLRELLYSLLYLVLGDNAWGIVNAIPELMVAVVLIAAGLWLLGLRPPHRDHPAEDLPPYPNNEQE